MSRPFYLATPPTPTVCACAATSAPATARSGKSPTRYSTARSRKPNPTEPRRHGDPRRRGERIRARRRPQRGPHRRDDRHRRDHSARAGPHHPVVTPRRQRRPGRSGYWQDRRGPAPRGLPAHTHRDLLARSGVLIIGPNTEFLRYISQVLPSSARPACCSRPSAICCPAWTPTSSTRRAPRSSRAPPTFSTSCAATSGPTSHCPAHR